jgi:hypothetical protein
MDFDVFRYDAAVRDVRVRDVPTRDVQELDEPDPIDTPDPVDMPTVIDMPTPLDARDAGMVMDAADAVDAPNVDQPNVDMPNVRDVPSDVPDPCSGPIVVNEVQTTGVGGGTDEWVELHNNGNCEVVLSGWTLVYRSSSGVSATTIYNFTAADRLAPNSQLLIAGAAFMPANAALRRFAGGGGLAQTAGGVGLFNAAARRMDSMAWGPVAMDHPFAEPMMPPVVPTAAPGSNRSVARTPNGRDTDNNANDFREVPMPTPGAPN